MIAPTSTLLSSTRPIHPALAQLLTSLKPGQKIRLTQTVRVGGQQWTTTTTGAFREVNYMLTGLATDRVPEDEIVIVMVHFTKENGEHSSIALYDQSKVELI